MEHEIEDDIDSQMYDTEKKEVARGLKAPGQLGKIFESHWIPIGRALFAGRKFCMRITQSPVLMGKAYDDAFSGWLDRNGFTERLDLPEKERPPFLKEKERTAAVHDASRRDHCMAQESPGCEAPGMESSAHRVGALRKGHAAHAGP